MYSPVLTLSTPIIIGAGVVILIIVITAAILLLLPKPSDSLRPSSNRNVRVVKDDYDDIDEEEDLSFFFDEDEDKAIDEVEDLSNNEQTTTVDVNKDSNEPKDYVGDLLNKALSVEDAKEDSLEDAFREINNITDEEETVKNDYSISSEEFAATQEIQQEEPLHEHVEEQEVVSKSESNHNSSETGITKYSEFKLINDLVDLVKSRKRIILKEKAYVYNEKDEVDIKYVEGASVEVTYDISGNISIPAYRVFVNGKESKWNDVFEVELRKGDLVEIDTGVIFTLPEGLELVLESSEDSLKNHGLDFSESMLLLNRVDLLEPITVEMVSFEDGYLSKCSNVIKGRVRPKLVVEG